MQNEKEVNLIRANIKYNIEFLQNVPIKSKYNSGQRTIFVFQCIMSGNDPKNVHGTRYQVGLSLNAYRSLLNYIYSLGFYTVTGKEFILGTYDYKKYYCLLKHIVG